MRPSAATSLLLANGRREPHCEYCNRRMEGHWNNQAPYYRCRFAIEYAIVEKIVYPRNVYVREDAIVPSLDRWLARRFDPANLTGLVHHLHKAQTGEHSASADAARREIAGRSAPLPREEIALIHAYRVPGF